jgi:hypothetical protein
MKSYFVFACFAVLALFTASVSNADLVSHWTGDNTPSDNVGSNDGALEGGMTYDASGKIGQGRSSPFNSDELNIERLSGCVDAELSSQARRY